MKRILVIDDSPLVIEAVRDALESDGIAVAELADVAQAERPPELDEFSLILLDVQMPARLGPDVAKVMRRRSRRTTPVVLLSSLSAAELDERAKESGLDGYILKERGVDELVDEVRAWLDGRRSRVDSDKGP